MTIEMKCRPPYTIVLAAGEGTRLRPLTRALFGTELPKQFCPLLGGRSLLGATLERALHFSPADRILVVVASSHERIARGEIDRHAPGAELVAQPRNIGTGPGILLPLSRVAAREPGAPLVILPSDHYVADVLGFASTVRNALISAERRRSTVLLGAVAHRPDPEYGWIQPDPAPAGEPSRVREFIEKPSLQQAHVLFESGALWNTFVMTGCAGRFWDLGRRHLSEQTARLAEYGELGACSAELEALYAELPFGDFSKDVLQRADGLEVLALPACGWSDWGTPERVLADLLERPELAGGTQHRAPGLRRGAAEGVLSDAE